MTRILSVLVVLTLIFSCKKLPTYYSLDQKKLDFSDVNYSGYDKDFDIRWLVFNTDTSLNLWLDTDNPLTVRKLLYTGFKIHVDPETKRQKAYSIHFPLKTDKTFTLEDFKNRELEIKLGDKGIYTKKVTEIPKMVQYKVANKLTKEYNYLYEYDPSKITLTTKDHSVVYKIELPYSKFGIKDLDNFSIGIESGMLKFDYPENSTAPSPTSPNSNSVMGSGLGNRQQNLRSYSDMEAPIKIWFKVEKTNI